MKVYLVIIEDRHADVEVRPFYDADKAVAKARELAKEYDRFGDYEESQIADWLFYASYSCEGDCVRVVEAEINK